jgi:hypothetical protein
VLDRMPTLLRLGGIVALVFAALAVTGCGGSDEESVAPDELSALRQDARYWKQLTSLFEPVEATSMSDHRAYMLPSGYLLALHFDNLDLEQARNLNWVALGVPGRFCKSDQARVEKKFGPGFTHFHDLAADTHGGKPGAKGVWFVHSAVRGFEAPWGQVAQGVDSKFMPTAAPNCAAT